MTSLENSANDDLEKKKKRRRRLLPLLLLLLLLLLGGGGVLAGKLLTPKGDRLARTPQEFRKKAEMKKDEVQKILQNAFYCVVSAEEMACKGGPAKRMVASLCGSGYFDEKADVLYFTGVFLNVPEFPVGDEYDREQAVVFPTKNGDAEFLLSPDLWGKTLLFAVHHPAGIEKPSKSKSVEYRYRVLLKAIRDIRHVNGKILWSAGTVIGDGPGGPVGCYVGDMSLEEAMDLAGALPLSERAYLYRASFGWVSVKLLPDKAGWKVTSGGTEPGWAKVEVFGPGKISVVKRDKTEAESKSKEGKYEYNGYTLPSDHCLVGIRNGGRSRNAELQMMVRRSSWTYIPSDPREQAVWEPEDARWYNYQKQEVGDIIASKFGEATARQVIDAIPTPSMDYFDRTVSAPGGYKIRIFAEAGSQILYVDVIRPDNNSEPCQK